MIPATREERWVTKQNEWIKSLFYLECRTISESLNLHFACQKNVLKTQFNCSWFCLLSFLGGLVTLQFPQVPERYFGHLACQMGCRVHSMRQVPYKKPPCYCPSTRRVSYKVYSLTSFTDALHEQTLLKLNDTAWYSDLQEVEKRSDLSPHASGRTPGHQEP